MVFGRKINILGKRWFWAEKPTFSWEKDGFGQKTNFFLGKRWFWAEKKTFSREKMVFGKQLFPRENQKNHNFELWPHVSQKIFLGVFCFP